MFLAKIVKKSKIVCWSRESSTVPGNRQLFPGIVSRSRESSAVPGNRQLFPGIVSCSRESPAVPGNRQLFPGIVSRSRESSAVPGNRQLVPGIVSCSRESPGVPGNRQPFPGIASCSRESSAVSGNRQLQCRGVCTGGVTSRARPSRGFPVGPVRVGETRPRSSVPRFATLGGKRHLREVNFSLSFLISGVNYSALKTKI